MKIGVVGSGVWGTALAIAAVRAGSTVEIWSRNSDVAADINIHHRNSKYLPYIKLSHDIIANTNISCAANCDAILLVVPAQNLREICKLISYSHHVTADSSRIKSSAASVKGVVKINKNIKGMFDIIYKTLRNNKNMMPTPVPSLPVNVGIKKDTPIVICAKGVEQGTLSLMSDIVLEYFPNNPVAVLSGPNFADEIAKGLPACATLACSDKGAADKLIASLGSRLFRIYYSNDMIGAQIGGSIKNVIAIACGISIGMGLGQNASAALVTRGMAEIGRLCKRMGGRQETLLGLSGLGDIVLTCGSEKSRNMSLGIEIGKGGNVDEILAVHKTVEGVETSKSVSILAKKLGLEMPITNAIKAILHDHASVEETVKKLLERPFTAEVS